MFAHDKRILVVDDEQGILELLESALTDRGYDVSIAMNGQQALEMWQAHPFDLVISDINMPKMNGWQLMQTIKEINPETRVILISGFYSAGIYKDMADDFITKPIELDDLYARVEKFKPLH